MKQPLLHVTNLRKTFVIKQGIFQKKEVTAVDDVSFTLQRGEIMGLVGESGSGKSTLAYLIARLVKPTSGEISFQGENFLSLRGGALRKKRREIQMVFQDPLSSLNPRKSILDNIGEALIYHKIVKTKEEQKEQVTQILAKVGLSPDALLRYPHQFSGGQQQRISIGRAIALQPQLLICDEAVSALDLSVRAQILNLLYEIKQKLTLSYLFISHDLSVIHHFCDRILVMYRGKIVEEGKCAELFQNPQHPYTKKLLASLPRRYPARH